MGSSLPFLRSEAAEGAGMVGRKRQEVRNQLVVEPPCPRGFEFEPQPGREEEGPCVLG